MTEMPEARARRAAAVMATIAIVVGGCGATPSPSPNTAQTASPPPSASPSPSPVATASPVTKASPIAERPGYILLEHFGNAADGTTLEDKEAIHLWLVKPDGTDLHELAPRQPLITGVVAAKGAPDWSPDGTHIAFGTESPFPLIYETDVAGTTPRLISTDCRPDPTSCYEFFPSYSPDGKRIAFVRITDHQQSGVLGIRELASGKVTLLEPTRQGPPKNELGAPRWSPDGTQLVYFEVARTADGTQPASSELFIVNVDGTGRHAIATPGLKAGDADWSPDGSTIVFAVDPLRQWQSQGAEVHPDVYEIRPDGTGLKRLTSDVGSAGPSWTADGHILYFSQRHLWLMDADGSHQKRIGPGDMNLVSDTTGFSYYSRWQPGPT